MVHPPFIARRSPTSLSKFERGQVVKHLKSGHTYVIVHVPQDGFRIEKTNERAYVYHEQPGAFLWVRSVAEMEDGRFI